MPNDIWHICRIIDPTTALSYVGDFERSLCGLLAMRPEVQQPPHKHYFTRENALAYRLRQYPADKACDACMLLALEKDPP